MSNQCFRKLNAEEIKTLFSIFDKHNGNILAMSKDPDCQFKNRNQITYYVQIYNLYSKLQQVITERSNKFKEITHEELLQAKKLSIEKAIGLLSQRIGLTSLGVKIELEPTYKDIKTAYEIIKVELGEPITINRNENENKDDTETKEHLEKLNELINNVKAKTTGITSGSDRHDPLSC